jgi:hypothetical protein
VAAFQVGRDGKSLEVTLTRLGPSAGSLLDNVNRWRSQVALAPMSADELRSSVRSLKVAGQDCDYVHIDAPHAPDGPQTVLVVVIARDDQTLFAKLMGDRELAAEEQARFEQFVSSIQFGHSEPSDP